MFGLYTFKDINGKTRMMQAATIHKKVMEDCSKSRYNWIASVTELISVCKEKDFPLNYAIDIKIAILNCFSVLIIGENNQRKKPDVENIYYAYNSLFGLQNEEATNARRNFLNGFLTNIYWQALQSESKNKSFINFCNDWKNEKLEELINIENLNFNEIKVSLKEDFKKAIQSADINDLSREENYTDDEFMRKLLDDLENTIKKYGTPDKPNLKELTITTY